MNYRKNDAHAVRTLASELAKNRPHLRHVANGDELKFRHKEDTIEEKCDAIPNKASAGDPSYLMSFTKGLPHNEVTGLIENPNDFQYLVRGIDSGDIRDFRDTPLGYSDNVNNLGCDFEKVTWHSEKGKETNKIRAWESQSAGLSFDLEGPDAQAVTMPPHPNLGSPELSAEMAEVYVQAIVRDRPFNALTAGVINQGKAAKKAILDVLGTSKTNVDKYLHWTKELAKLDWFNPDVDIDLCCEERKRRRNKVKVSPSNAFRGITPGDDIGPYLSQFLLVGNRGISDKKKRNIADGLITYGSQTINQKVQDATNVDYLTNWEEWLDAQNGADFRGLEKYNDDKVKFIATPRDLATYVHYDALYQAYLNACLILLSSKAQFDPGIPFQEADRRDHQQGFAHFGGPHILSLVTEVATRALKAVRFQKYNVHRRCRPEVLAARIHKAELLSDAALELNILKNDIAKTNILDGIGNMNGGSNYLLPMAFYEGSPMHPSYGAGHATVAGACVTILKAFFDHKRPLAILGDSDTHTPSEKKEIHTIKKALKNDHLHGSNVGYVPSSNGEKLNLVPIYNQEGKLSQLTIEGELNKLASNISIGRDWAGVHYFTDYYESLLMGEEIAIGILEEQKLTYRENFSMTVPLFGGGSYRI